MDFSPRPFWILMIYTTTCSNSLVRSFVPISRLRLIISIIHSFCLLVVYNNRGSQGTVHSWKYHCLRTVFVSIIHSTVRLILSILIEELFVSVKRYSLIIFIVPIDRHNCQTIWGLVPILLPTGAAIVWPWWRPGHSWKIQQWSTVIQIVIA